MAGFVPENRNVGRKLAVLRVAGARGRMRDLEPYGYWFRLPQGRSEDSALAIVNDDLGRQDAEEHYREEERFRGS